MKLAKNFGVASVAIVMSVTAVGNKPTHAAVIEYDFTVNAISGNNPGQYYGSFEYDDSSLTGTGLENLGVGNGLAVTFNYLNTIYTEKNDELYDSFPVVSFNNGKLSGLSYFVADKFFIGSEVDTPQIGGNKFYSILSGESLAAAEIGTVSYSKVPEPFTLGGTAIAGAMGLWIKRKNKASKVAD
ncbi:PEP-CTERM sorting domain-containing protein [Komarekiella sp. 'clone 1']|uniref:PEP-CTERM sorting domain-containing protein n=1 Tax=Komarekiella delphini-convector SJRDD-AB1 TaxID=2593771 RepID=A0AA40VTT0_9NOST|nr:PEP-CTERM sorting domain-containing protein [Komarekiella delphini-convector]MBD6619497.1 PEP-CTERM sorting domain-containing protein [Komarekiella delphini-convector SJRDD-AB1]